MKKLGILFAAFFFAAVAPAHAQPFNPGIVVSGTPANNDCAKFVVSGGNVQSITTTGGSCSAASPVQSVFGRTGAVVAVSGDYTVAQVTGAAPLASPALTGNPTAPTQTTSDNSTLIATDAFVKAAIVANSPVLSVFGRTGAVVAATNDYNFNQLAGSAACVQLPNLTGQVTSAACATVLATAQPDVHTWALTQTFSVSPVLAGIKPPSDSTSAIQVFKADGITTVAMFDTTNGRFNIGANIAPDSFLTLNANTGASVAPLANTIYHIIQADGVAATVVIDTYAAAFNFVPRRADGTQASKTATSASANITAIAGQAWDGTSYNTIATVDIITGPNTQSSSDHGGYIRFRTVAPTTTSLSEKVQITPIGGLNLGNTLAILIASEFGMNKISASGSAPGAGTAKIAWVAGTNANTCKLISYAGTSTTPVTIVDNVGGGC